MDLQDVLDWLNKAGFAFQWRAEPSAGNAQAILRPSNGQSLSLGNVEVAIVIPDVHLGVGNDVFHTANPAARYSARLLGFLTALAKLRDQVGANRFCVAQVGDWYDLYRAGVMPPTVEAQITAIEGQYGDVCNAARALPVLHCIGNHDAALYKNPHATSSRFGIAQIIGTPAVMAYHGHDDKTLQTIQARDLGDTIGLSLVNLLAMIPLVGSAIDWVQMAIDDSFNEAWSSQSGDKEWPAAAAGSTPTNWTAPWVARSDSDALVRAARGMEYITNTALEVVLVGHSHRPGISSAWVTAERQIPLIDVGSWTYGRAEIAIITRDGIGLAAIPMH